MSIKKISIYFLLPLGVTSALIAMYFSGVETLQLIVSPRIRWMNLTSGREFGLLENLQNVILVAMMVVAIMGLRKKRLPIEKAGMAFIAVFSLFIFLEEIDYGLHHYEYLRKIPWHESAETRNWHNVAERTDITKQVVDVSMILFFVIAPLVLAKSQQPLIRFLTPSRYLILTMLAMLLVRTLAHQLKDRGVGTSGTIDNNLSEFRELVIYYLFLLYLIEIALRRTLAPEDAGASAEE